jgi:hypothetical protein
MWNNLAARRYNDYQRPASVPRNADTGTHFYCILAYEQLDWSVGNIPKPLRHVRVARCMSSLIMNPE